MQGIGRERRILCAQLDEMKNVIVVWMALSCVIGWAQVPEYVPADGLVAWYPFDGSLIDASGMVEEGVANGTSFGSDRWSNEGSALQIASGSFANLGMQNQLALLPEDTLTIAMWSRPDSQEGLGVTKYQNGNGSGSSWFVHDGFESGVRVFGNGTSGTPNEDEWYQTCPNVTDGWSHIIVVFEGESVTLRVDGTLICQTTMPVSSSTQSQPVLIGRSNCSDGSNCNHSEGRIDDLGFWNRALSSEEALQLFLGAVAVYGCMDSQACNFNPEANVDDGSCIPSGCMDFQACNFSPEAECEGEVCDYSCCPGPGCCSIGHYWDWNLEKCLDVIPSDTDFDGCVGMTDLLDLLSVFGTCTEEDPEETEWSCGDPLTYQGHDYETVQIGGQCWFAENLRSEHYLNGDAISSELTDEEWQSTTSGAVTVFGEGTSDCFALSPDGDACDEFWSLSEYGRLYNWYAVDDSRGLCPGGWRVPSSGDWTVLTSELGGESVAGAKMKTVFGWHNGGNGTNSSGFSGLPGGYRNFSGSFGNGEDFGIAGANASWWSSTAIGASAWYRSIDDEGEGVYLGDDGLSLRYGYSIRCVHESE